MQKSLYNVLHLFVLLKKSTYTCMCIWKDKQELFIFAWVAKE